MFDEVTKREGGRRAARKGAYLAGSTTFQVAVLAGAIFLSERIRAEMAEGPIVDVKFVKPAAPPPPPPPPAPPKRKSTPRPPDAPKPPPPPPPTAMIQPKDVQEEIKLPDPGSKPEPEPEYDGPEGDGDGGGVIGGVVGAGGGGIEEAPQYATAGWRPPSMKSRNCVQASIRIPRDLQGVVTTVVAKFGIRPSGQPYAFSVLGSVPDKRIEQAIWQAIATCEWIPGADAQGRPVSIWVTLPLRFSAG